MHLCVLPVKRLRKRKSSTKITGLFPHEGSNKQAKMLLTALLSYKRTTFLLFINTFNADYIYRSSVYSLPTADHFYRCNDVNYFPIICNLLCQNLDQIIKLRFTQSHLQNSITDRHFLSFLIKLFANDWNFTALRLESYTFPVAVNVKLILWNGFFTFDWFNPLGFKGSNRYQKINYDAGIYLNEKYQYHFYRVIYLSQNRLKNMQNQVGLLR